MCFGICSLFPEIPSYLSRRGMNLQLGELSSNPALHELWDFNCSLGFKPYSPTRLRPGAGKRGSPIGALILEGCRHHQLKKTGAREEIL